MKYPLLYEVSDLVTQKLVSRRRHPVYPLYIYNYSPSAQGLPISKWSDALNDCRGLILDEDGNVIGRGFKKFWNYEQVLDKIPNEPFEVFEKLDGSLIIVCNYNGDRIVATRGSFESDQARWADAWLAKNKQGFIPHAGETWLFEGIFPANRIVVDYGQTEECVLLDVLDLNGTSIYYENVWEFRESKRYDGVTAFDKINEDPSLIGQEGFVVRWLSGFRAKVKIEEYNRLHRLITQCSTRTVWDLMRSGKTVKELLNNVPTDFGEWVSTRARELLANKLAVEAIARQIYSQIPEGLSRKEFASHATRNMPPYPAMLFKLLDSGSIDEMIWKSIEPKWSTPFRKEAEE